jgi:hypothetical protein
MEGDTEGMTEKTTPADIEAALVAARTRALHEMAETQIGTDERGRAVSLRQTLSHVGLPPHCVTAILRQIGCAYDTEMYAEWKRLFCPVEVEAFRRPEPKWKEALRELVWPAAVGAVAAASAFIVLIALAEATRFFL